MSRRVTGWIGCAFWLARRADDLRARGGPYAIVIADEMDDDAARELLRGLTDG